MRRRKEWETRGLTKFLTALAVGIFFATEYDGIDGDEDGKDTGEHGLHYDEDHSCDGLGGLSDTEFFYKD